MEKPTKKYVKLMKKIELLIFFRQKNKAISILNTQLQFDQYTINEKSSGLIRLGLLYVSMKNYKKASEVFDRALLLVKDQQFSYHPNFIIILQTFEKVNMNPLLNFWREDFLKRVPYDKKYLNLKSKILHNECSEEKT